MSVKPSQPVKKLVVLEESFLASLANQASFLQEFPFLTTLKSLAPKKGGCGGCKARKQNNARAQAFTAVKASIASMGDDQKRKLKSMLNAKQVRVSYKQGTKIIQHTF